MKRNKVVIRKSILAHLGTVRNKLTLIDFKKELRMPLVAILRCECGCIIEKTHKDFMKGKVISCGCVSRNIRQAAKVKNEAMAKTREENGRLFIPNKDISKQTYGKLTVLYFCGVRIDSDGDRHSLWYCQCSCGNTCVKGRHGIVYAGHCGCSNYEAQKARALRLAAQRKNQILKYLEEEWTPRDDEDHKNRRLKGTIKAILNTKYPNGCVICNHKGDKHNRLCAHHYKAHALFPKLRYVIANQVILCEECHNKLHKELGWEDISIATQVAYIQTARL